MTAVATIEAAGVVIDHGAILRSLNLNPVDPKTQALLLICERYGLDPILRHVVLITGNAYVTRDGYLAIAHRSGKFDGMEVLDQGADDTHYTAKVAVWRKDMGRPFTFIGRFPKSKSMAKEYGPEMAVKVAEVQALRRAFNVTGVGASDERWDVEPSEVHAAPPNGHAPLALAAGADPETGEIVAPTTTRRPPPAAPTVPCPESSCTLRFVSKSEAVPHLVTAHGWTEDGGKVHPPSAPSSTDAGPPATDDDVRTTSAGSGVPTGGGEAVAAVPSPASGASNPTLELCSHTQMRKLHAAIRSGMGRTPTVPERHMWASAILDREVVSFNSLTRAEAGTLIERAEAGDAPAPAML